MRIVSLIIVLCFTVCLLGACSTAQQVENQAYVLTMGLDQLDSGLQLTVQIPKIASSAEQENASGGSSNYFQFSTEGKSFEETIEKLEWLIPRELNLSHLKMIVLSENLASSEACRDILYDVMHTERLFSAARVVVCNGRAEDFIKQLKPVVGHRLSTDILSTFEHYVDQGFVPDSNLADLYYATESVYSDPMATFGVISKPTKASSASATGGEYSPLNGIDSEISTHYPGAALFSEGVYKGNLTLQQTIFTNLLKGSLKTFRYEHDDQGLEIFPQGTIKVEIDLKTTPIQIHINPRLNISAQEDVPDLEGLKNALEADISDSIFAARTIGVEPFGFAEIAARQFFTLDSWIDFNWLERFLQADIHVDVWLQRTGS